MSERIAGWTTPAAFWRGLPHLAGPHACWVWRGHLNRQGYGVVAGWNPATKRRLPQAVHRISYQFFIGPIPDGLVIDHLCRNRACCNPSHLEPVTNMENLRRGRPNIGAIHAAQTHCIHGHEFTPENTYRPPGSPTRRICRECHRRNAYRRAVAAREAR